MSVGVNTGYDAAAAQRAAEEEARRRAEEEERRKAEEKKRAQEAQKEQERKDAEEAQEKANEESVFEEEETDGLKRQEIKNYDEWIESLHARGLNTTHINNGEANFSDYGNALSTDLQQRILNSFDNDQDYVLQQTLAALFTDGNFENQGDIYAKCKALGISVSCEYVATTYIVDNKAAGFNKDHATNGHIAVYTFSDGKGGEIVIADANGNGGLETEELFANEILSGIASDLKADASKNVHGSFSSSGGGRGDIGAQLNSILNGKTKSFSELLKELKDLQEQSEEEKEELGNRKVISRATFDQMVREKAEELVEEESLQFSVAYNRALEVINKEYAV